MQDHKSLSRAYLYISIGLFAVPVLIAGSTVLNIDESGLGTAFMFFFIGFPSIIIGTIFAIMSAVSARKVKNVLAPDSTLTRVIKIILGFIILIMLSLPVLYVLNFIRILVFGD